MFASRTEWSLTPNRLAQRLAERRRQGLPILDLTESNPTRCGFQFPAQAILEALAAPRALTYEPHPQGLHRAREAVAAYYAEKRIAIAPEQVFLTASTSEAYAYVFRLLADPGDNILAPFPSYPLFDYLGRLNDVEVIAYPLVYDHGWQLDRETLRKRVRVRSRAVLVVHPNNPTGSFIRREELESLIACCREHSLALVADEVFADYAFAPDSQRVVSHAGTPDVLTFTLSGLSKISALPQMKVAWTVLSGPEAIVRDAVARLEVIADTYLSVSAPVAHALPSLLEVRRPVQPQVLARARDNLGRLDELLAAGGPVSRLEVAGGWYVVLKLPAIRSDEDWALELLDRDGVLVHPGHFYDFPVEGHLVVSLLPPPAVLYEGVKRILSRVAM